MISLMLNGAQETRAACTLLTLVQEKQLGPERVVLELNGAIIKRPQWAEIVLQEGDALEIVCFVGGG